MKRRNQPTAVREVPDAIAAGATWDEWCALIRRRITAKTRGEHAVAQAGMDRLNAWYEAHGVDPGGSWGVGRWVLCGADVMPRAVWERERGEDARALREMRRHG